MYCIIGLIGLFLMVLFLLMSFMSLVLAHAKFPNKTTPLLRPLETSPMGGLNREILLYLVHRRLHVSLKIIGDMFSYN